MVYLANYQLLPVYHTTLPARRYLHRTLRSRLRPRSGQCGRMTGQRQCHRYCCTCGTDILSVRSMCCCRLAKQNSSCTRKKKINLLNLNQNFFFKVKNIECSQTALIFFFIFTWGCLKDSLGQVFFLTGKSKVSNPKKI